MPFKKNELSQRIHFPLLLFLDYDGTLADFAPNPDIIQPDKEIIEILTTLKLHEQISLAIISGRKLDNLMKLIPIPGIILAGTYGIEIRMPDGSIIHRKSFDNYRPTLETIKSKWKNLLRDLNGFYLEDKGWSLAIHAQDANDLDAEQVLTAARMGAEDQLNKKIFQVLPGTKFLEICPLAADKGKCVEFLLRKNSHPNNSIIYFGDDDKDEKAFSVVQAKDGIAVRVGMDLLSKGKEDFRLKNPQAVRGWLKSLISSLK